MNDPVDQSTIDAVPLDSEVAMAINRLMLATWPKLVDSKIGTVEFLLQRWEHYSGPYNQRPLYHLSYQAGELIGLAHTFARAIASRDGEMTIMGLANVCVAKFTRGYGYGRLVVQTAFNRINRGDFSVTLFQTTPQIRPFYARLGAVEVRNRFFNSLAEDPHANPFWDPIAMRYPATADWPDSEIDIRGPGY